MSIDASKEIEQLTWGHCNHQLSKQGNSGKIASQMIPTFRGGCHIYACRHRVELQGQWRLEAVAKVAAALRLLVQLSPLLCLLRAKQHFPAEVFGCDAVHVRAVPPFELASASSVALYFASAHRKQGTRANEYKQKV